MENEILELLKLNDKALSVYDIYDALNLKTTEDLKNLMKELNKLEDNLQIYRTKKDNYLLFQNCHLKVGTFIGNKKGFGFVDIDGDDDVHIACSFSTRSISKCKDTHTIIILHACEYFYLFFQRFGPEGRF